MPSQTASEVTNGMGLVCSANPYLGIAPVLEGLVVFLDTFTVEQTIGLERTDNMPTLAAAEFDQFGRSIPGIKGYIYWIPFRQYGGHFHQHGPGNTILAAETQPIFRLTLAVEPANRFFSQVQLCIEGEP